MHIDPARKALTLLDEFKNFAFKGNVVDLAVGVIIGGAFGKIVDSLVKCIIMPSISVLLPGQKGYLAWKLVINNKEIPYGLFIGDTVNFLIVALALFFFIAKFLRWVLQVRKEEAKGVALAVASLTKDQELLSEIRDVLKAKLSSTIADQPSSMPKAEAATGFPTK
jgi:large conductance mechanosensitive channel